MRKFALLTVLLLFGLALFAQENRYEIKGEFSFSYPQGWQKVARPNAASEPEWLVMPGVAAMFRPVVGHGDSPLKKWVDESVKANATDKRVLLSRAEFVTAAGEKGVKLRWKSTTKSNTELLLDEYYFTRNKGIQLQFTGVAPFGEAETYEPVYDANMKSLVLEK